MLQGVYQDNLRLTEPTRTRRPRLLPRPRRWRSRTLLTIALAFGSALGYLSPSLLLSGQERALTEELAARPLPPELAAWAQRPTSASPLGPAIGTRRPPPFREPEPLPEMQTAGWSELDLLLDEELPPLTAIFGLDVKTIVIDAGHGGRDPGALGARGTMEKDITLDVALRLRDRLNAYGRYKILMTRETDKSLRLDERVAFANENEADLFISIHVNAFPDQRVKTIETYYFGAPQDKETAELAELENADSHYRMADFKTMIGKLANTMKHQESAALAASVQHNLFKNVHKIDHQVRNFGVKTAPFVVLLGVDAPSVLAEISCITNAEEERRLNTPAYREKIASFIEQGVHQYLRHKQSRIAGDHRHERESNG
jgi:N-acetylmuramoyl-L-alanine amidase